MANHGKTFKFELGFADRLGKSIQKAEKQYDRIMESRVKKATDMVWRIAHQKRPMMSKAQMRYEGRSSRVSDPGAEAGVPVRTGTLQGSIQQVVEKVGILKYQGIIFTKGIKYASFIEYGTFKMWARPYMRPAVNLTKDAIKRVFNLRVGGDL